jgi:hypothetical protein
VWLFSKGCEKQRRADSTSAVLEQILRAVKRETERAAIERAVSDYYSSLTESEAEELAQWGEFALSRFPEGVA